MVKKLDNSSTYANYVSQLLHDDKFKQPKVGKQNDQAHAPIHPVKTVEKDSLNAR